MECSCCSRRQQLALFAAITLIVIALLFSNSPQSSSSPGSFSSWLAFQSAPSTPDAGASTPTKSSSSSGSAPTSSSTDDDDGDGSAPSPPFSPMRDLTPAELSRLKSSASKQQEQNNYQQRISDTASRGFHFHVYQLPRQYVEGAIDLLETMWPVSICNRGKKKTNYTMLDWRHAHSLFTADVYITRYLRLHPQHTDDPAEADVFIIPMMTHLYNCIGRMGYMVDILNHVYDKYSRHYREMDHRDHYLFWWRWGMHFGGVQKFWKKVVRYFPNINLISFDLLEIMGRNQFQDFSLALKPRFDRNLLNIIMPYPDLSPQLSGDVAMNSSSADGKPRDVLFYFAGTSTIGGIRRWIKWNCDVHNAKKQQQQRSMSKDCVYVDFATSVVDTKRLGVPTDYPSAMQSATFCGHAAGDALSSRRPTSAILAGCIPVLICDLCLYAWESTLDYSAFAVFVPEHEVISGNLVKILQCIAANSTRMSTLRENLAKVRRHFVYHRGVPQEGDALDMLTKELATRGALMRQYRRWFRANAHLSSDLKDYPLDPPLAMKYVRRIPAAAGGRGGGSADGGGGALDKSDTEHSVHNPWPRKQLPVS